jgi:subtilase family serine protease
MNRTQKVLVFAILILSCVGVGVVASGQANAHNLYSPHLLKGDHKRVCSSNSNNQTDCLAQIITAKSGNPTTTTLPAGYGPAQFHGAYNLPTTSSNPGVIGIVDAYDDPNITSDLATYDKTFDLPNFPSCTSTITTSCFDKVNQNGGSSYPQKNSNWAIETSLDVQTAHEICQNCKIILVEANSSSYTDLMSSIDRARLMGATVISNSYGSPEFSSETTYDSHFNYPGIAFVFAAGDYGYGAFYPAASGRVTAVGGTTLTVNSSNAWQSESVWSDTGSGCSRYESKPSFQKDAGCSNRTVADISADADPNTGAAVYDSYRYDGFSGWYQVGGTSLATPIIAASYALANNVPVGTLANSILYSNYIYGTNLHDVISGSNGNCGSYLCGGTVGYDGPSGLGTPDGLGAF